MFNAPKYNTILKSNYLSFLLSMYLLAYKLQLPTNSSSSNLTALEEIYSENKLNFNWVQMDGFDGTSVSILHVPIPFPNN